MVPHSKDNTQREMFPCIVQRKQAMGLEKIKCKTSINIQLGLKGKSINQDFIQNWQFGVKSI